jgi:hypothetical protein
MISEGRGGREVARFTGKRRGNLQNDRQGTERRQRSERREDERGGRRE